MPTPYEILRTELMTDPLARGYAGMTATQAATSLNTANRTVAVQSAFFTPSQILEAIVPADLSNLLVSTTTALFQTNSLKLSMLNLLLSGTTVDTSPGTIRTMAISLFQGSVNLGTDGKTTIQRLNTLVSSYDTPPNITRAAEIGWPTDVPLTSLEVTYARNLS